MDFADLAMKVVIAVLGGGIGGFVARATWVSQRWWEKKDAAYTAVLDALYTLESESAFYAARDISEFQNGTASPKSGDWSAIIEAMDTVKRNTSVNQHAISADALDIIKEFWDTWDNRYDLLPPEVAEHMHSTVTDSLQKFSHAARQDLKR